MCYQADANRWSVVPLRTTGLPGFWVGAPTTPKFSLSTCPSCHDEVEGLTKHHL